MNGEFDADIEDYFRSQVEGEGSITPYYGSVTVRGR